MMRLFSSIEGKDKKEQQNARFKELLEERILSDKALREKFKDVTVEVSGSQKDLHKQIDKMIQERREEDAEIRSKYQPR